MILIFLFSAQPADNSSALSGGVTEKLLEVTVTDYENLPEEVKEVLLSEVGYLIRKVAHFVEYAILGVLFLALLKEYFSLGWYVPLSAWILTTCYAATDELHQLFVPGRSGRISDVCLDSGGAFCGIFISLICLILLAEARHHE